MSVSAKRTPTANLQLKVPIQTLEALEAIAWRSMSTPGQSPQQTAEDEHEALVYIAFALAEILGKDCLAE